MLERHCLPVPHTANAEAYASFHELVSVLATGNEPLIGMSLLDGYDIRIQAVEGGLVSIEHL